LVVVGGNKNKRAGGQLGRWDAGGVEKIPGLVFSQVDRGFVYFSSGVW